MFSQATHATFPLETVTKASHGRDNAVGYRYHASGFNRDNIINSTRRVEIVWASHCKDDEISHFARTPTVKKTFAAFKSDIWHSRESDRMRFFDGAA